MKANIRLRIKEYDTFILIYLGGELLGSASDAFSDSLDNIAKQNNKDIIIDLKRFMFVDSKGLGGIMKFWHNMKSQNRLLAFVNLRNEMTQVFAVTKFDKLFKILPTLQDAIGWINSERQKQTNSLSSQE